MLGDQRRRLCGVTIEPGSHLRRHPLPDAGQPLLRLAEQYMIAEGPQRPAGNLLERRARLEGSLQRAEDLLEVGPDVVRILAGGLHVAPAVVGKHEREEGREGEGKAVEVGEDVGEGGELQGRTRVQVLGR